MIRNDFFNKVFGKYLYWIQNWYAGAAKARYRRAGLWTMSKSTQFCVLAELLTDVRTRHKTALGVQSNLLEKKEQLLCTLYMYTYCQLWNGSYGVVIEIQAKSVIQRNTILISLATNSSVSVPTFNIMNDKEESTKIRLSTKKEAWWFSSQAVLYSLLNVQGWNSMPVKS